MLLLLLLLLPLRVTAGEADPGRVAGRQPEAPLGQLLLRRRGRRGGRGGGVRGRRRRHHRAVPDAAVQSRLLFLPQLQSPLKQSSLPLG